MAPIGVEFFRGGFSGVPDEVIMPGHSYELGFGAGDADLKVSCDPQDKSKLTLTGRSFEDKLVRKPISFHGEYYYKSQRVPSENALEIDLPTIEDCPVKVRVGGKLVAEVRYISPDKVIQRT